MKPIKDRVLSAKDFVLGAYIEVDVNNLSGSGFRNFSSRCFGAQSIVSDKNNKFSKLNNIFFFFYGG